MWRRRGIVCFKCVICTLFVLPAVAVTLSAVVAAAQGMYVAQVLPSSDTASWLAQEAQKLGWAMGPVAVLIFLLMNQQMKMNVKHADDRFDNYKGQAELAVTAQKEIADRYFSMYTKLSDERDSMMDRALTAHTVAAKAIEDAARMYERTAVAIEKQAQAFAHLSTRIEDKMR